MVLLDSVVGQSFSQVASFRRVFLCFYCVGLTIISLLIFLCIYLEKKTFVVFVSDKYIYLYIYIDIYVHDEYFDLFVDIILITQAKQQQERKKKLFFMDNMIRNEENFFERRTEKKKEKQRCLHIIDSYHRLFSFSTDEDNRISIPLQNAFPVSNIKLFC